ncbi:hypothetical protein [Brachybacterium tyrofermentans]|uniref:hypothetical protein n=1 Tax=Brachybacterium tyrofermentans TaxID=47848 RepID=UPI001867390D|nr:hypothetical protein [Brachybacterium tyrofermentans]
MNEAVSTLSELSPLAAVVLIAGVLASVFTQLVKQPWWPQGRTQLVAVAASVVLGVVAYVVSGVAVGVPDSAVAAVSSGVLFIAGVAVMSRAVYAVMGHALPSREGATHRRS